MGRAGRYTLSVMVWVAAYAGWSSLIGLLVAAATGDRPRALSSATSALFVIIGPLVPTLTALWFNDWARDGFPTAADRRASRAVDPAKITSRPDPVAGIGRPAAVERSRPVSTARFPVSPMIRDD